MPLYEVNVTITMPGWAVIAAENAEDALAEAQTLDASLFEVDRTAAEVEFNVEPAVTERV